MKRNFFTFTQLGSEYSALEQDIRRGTPTAVFGVSDSLKQLISSCIPYPILYVTADAVSAKRAAVRIRRRAW